MWSIVGHERAVAHLARSLQAGRLSHAYVFVGPEQVGKHTLAINLAQAVNCTGQDKPCGSCAQCKRIADGKHSDVQTLSLETVAPNQRSSAQRKEISIEVIRELQRMGNLQPFEGQRRVFIIDGAEHLSTDAANCLLKTLEEPPATVLLILLAAEDRRLLPTVLSRCQRMELEVLSREVISDALKAKWGADAERAQLLARFSEGRIGWAIQAARDPAMVERRAEQLEPLLDLPEAGYGDKFAVAAELSTTFGRDRHAVQDRLALWRGWWRDLMLIKAGKQDSVTNMDRKALLDEQAAALSQSQVLSFLKSLNSAQQNLNKNANSRLVFEVLMLDLPPVSKGHAVA